MRNFEAIYYFYFPILSSGKLYHNLSEAFKADF